MSLETRNNSPVGGVHAVSFNQEGILLAEAVTGDRARFRAPHFPVAFRVSGAPDRAALVRALDELGRRHESLRTSFEPTTRYSARDRSMQIELYRHTGLFVPGLFHQRVDEVAAIPWKTHQVDATNESAVAALVEDEIDEAFSGGHRHRPRALLVRVPSGEDWLILVLSHAVADGWSLQILQRELPTVYAASVRGEVIQLPPAPGSYRQFARNQQTGVASGAFDLAAAYWLRQWTEFGDAHIRHRELPLARSMHGPPAIRRQVQACAPPVSIGLVDLARRLRTSPFAVVRTAFTVVLHTYTGKRRVAIWANFANRRGVPEGLFGHCSNTHLVGAEVSRDASCASLARQIAGNLIEAQAHEALPVTALWRHTGRNLAAQCDCRISFDYVPEARTLPGAVLRPMFVGGGRRWMDLDLRLRQSGTAFLLQATYDSNRYADLGVADLLANVTRVLSRWLDDDRATVASCASVVR